MKICRDCKIEKELYQFYKNKECLYGVRPECKTCFNLNPSRKLSKIKHKNSELYKLTTKIYNQSKTHKVKLKIYKQSIKGKAQKSIEGIKRRASSYNAIPKWLTKDQENKIKEIYLKCAELNLRDGPRSWHVDHIIPLRGKNISGLHVPENLQILKAEINISKGNKYGKIF